MLAAQTVTITGTTPVDIGCEYKYDANVSNIPSSWTVVDYEWQATFIGPNGKMRYISSFDNQGNPVFITTSSNAPIISKTKELWATWDGFHYPGQASVNFKIRYTLAGSSFVNSSQTFNTSPSFFAIKGIPTNVTLSGPATVQKCCISNVTYTVPNPGDANSFDQWTYPVGWTLVSQIGSSITLRPDATTSGIVSCRVGITTACPALYRNASISVNRIDADITIVTAEFPLLRICPNSSYTYKINPVCGVSSYSWQFPSGWTITSGGNTASVVVTTGTFPQSGDIIATANFNGCASVSKSTAINPLTGAPPKPSFNLYFNNYHCDAWYVCRNGGRIWHYVQNEAQTYTYTVSSPWRFINASGQAVNTITLPFEEQPPLISLPSGINRNSGTYTVRANNCLGSSTILSTVFTRENDCWCIGTIPYPYQNGVLNPCLSQPSSCGPVPLSTVSTQNPTLETPVAKNNVFPNPAKNNVLIETTENGTKIIRITSQVGKVVSLTNTMQQRINIDVSKWAAGLYWVEIIASGKTIFTHKLIVNK